MCRRFHGSIASPSSRVSLSLRQGLALEPENPKFHRVHAMAALYGQQYGTAVRSYLAALYLRRGQAYNRVGTSVVFHPHVAPSPAGKGSPLTS